MSKKSLQNAKQAQNDEFYTKYETIEKEIPYYKKHLKGKAVYCNCDNPDSSNFWKFLYKNFKTLGLASLMASFYSPDGDSFLTEAYPDRRGSLHIAKRPLAGDGSFSSKECIALLKKCDVVITNPPWSRGVEFLDLIYKNRKKFIVLINQNVLTAKEILPHLIKGDIYNGISIRSGDTEFSVPSSYPLNSKNSRIADDGTKYISVTSARWLTNIKHDHFPEPLALQTMAWNLKNNTKLLKRFQEKYKSDTYVRYDNCTALEVPYSDGIPSDVNMTVGVPISFIDRFNPSQFSIVGVRKGDDGKDLKINGIAPYCRILIQRKGECQCQS